MLGLTKDPDLCANPSLVFHNAVMKWKCASLTDEERQEHQDWINREQEAKEKMLNNPWKATQAVGGNELSMENGYVQRCGRPS